MQTRQLEVFLPSVGVFGIFELDVPGLSWNFCTNCVLHSTNSSSLISWTQITKMGDFLARRVGKNRRLRLLGAGGFPNVLGLNHPIPPAYIQPRQPRQIDVNMHIHVHHHDVHGNNAAPAPPASPLRGQVDSQQHHRQQRGMRVPDQRPRNEPPNTPARGGNQDAVRPRPEAAKDQKVKKEVRFADMGSEEDDAEKKRELDAQKRRKEEEARRKAAAGIAIKVAEQKKRADKKAADPMAAEKEKEKANTGRNTPGNKQKGNGRQQKPGRPAGGK